MLLTVPELEPEGRQWPSLGGQVCEFITDNLVHGPGDLRGEPAQLDDEKRWLLWRMYEVYPPEHPHAGRRRFKRAALMLAKGVGKTEFAAWIAAAELHPAGPVRCVGWDGDEPIGGGVTDPYIPMVAYTEEQSDELAYGALKAILEESYLADDFDIGLERILRIRGDGKAVSLAGSPSARDGARTTFAIYDEPLAIDTPVPTPDGWATMGELRTGDSVFGRDGQVCRVLGGSEVHEGRTCYRVTFGDGSTIVADAGHRWAVYDRAPSYRCERVVTTSDMFSHRWANGTRFRVVSSGPLQGPLREDLAVEPYLLGLWLGNGDSANATVSFGGQDMDEVVAHVESLGYRTSRCESTDRAPLIYVTHGDNRSRYHSGRWHGSPHSETVVGRLRAMGLLKNKHIPLEYLRASVEQRLELLRGLMDSDGYISSAGHCTFVNHNEQLLDQTSELLRTLGYRPRKAERRDPRYEAVTTYKLHFSPGAGPVPFRLERKAVRCRNKPGSIARANAVAHVEEVASVPVRCIAVDSPDSLFLAGDGMVVTHNTHWWTLQSLKDAHRTMQANLPKRKAADAWALETTTAPEPGVGSVAEATLDYARAVKEGKIEDPRLMFYYRFAEAGDEALQTEDQVERAVREASGPTAVWRDVRSIVAMFFDPTSDIQFLRRVWLNQLVQQTHQAFDVEAFRRRATSDSPVRPGDLVTLGFDGAQFRDATGLVATHVESGYQWVAGCWEQPPNQDKWQVPVEEVDAALATVWKLYSVWRLYADPPYWQSWISKWQGEYGEDNVVEWWTNRRKQMATALESYETAISEGSLSHSGDPRLVQHVANAHRMDLPQRDENGRPLWLIRKARADSPHKIDLAMAAVLSWEARNDAIAAGATANIEAGIDIL